MKTGSVMQAGVAPEQGQPLTARPWRPKPAPPGAAALREAWQSLSKHPARQLMFPLLRDMQEPKPSTRLCHRRDSKGYVC